MEYRLRAAKIRAVITNLDGAEKLDGFDGLRFLVGGELAGWRNFQRGVREATPSVRYQPTASDSPGILFFTSATTGEPKMVLHTQTSYGLGHEVTGRLWLDLHPGDVHWNISDPGWGKAAWWSFYGPWHTGAGVFAADTPGNPAGSPHESPPGYGRTAIRNPSGSSSSPIRWLRRGTASYVLDATLNPVGSGALANDSTPFSDVTPL